MEQGLVYIYSGDGHGKSPAALGRAVMTASLGKRVVIIQFLKGKGLADSALLSRLEPEIKIFSFAKMNKGFDELNQEEREDEIVNIKNGMHFAKKVLATGECDLLILDEVLGLINHGIITVDDLGRLLQMRNEGMDVILTGNSLNDEACKLADEVSRIESYQVG
ncbi:cob(I)yrinic acid a,c-diamide adenosyltransferase [Parablautia muri]|uniref:Cob(I)yrinic acid a c-diamide adenosyltransferase n=1 Tax=Parablautia muri TaxID=2320879 RepID=A0A9X5BIU9_9FIRM|nr:cob(I)yrinic acid a,c-diamide adenosyltransferase [Parablautia muri]NBJ94906.1 cob(I)yrinic acid a c-diamide adenosyltransferase [Parablautia muri]